MEALRPHSHWPTIAPAVDDFFVNGLVAGAIPILAPPRAKATVQFALLAAVDEFVGADEAGDDVVMGGWALLLVFQSYSLKLLILTPKHG